MRPAGFEYVRAGSVADAVRALDDGGPDARVLAGGQVLVNLMRARRVRPSVVIDISGLSELDFVTLEADHLAVGALTRMRDLAASEIVARAVPALAQAAACVGDPQVRNRATAGGNLLNPDPVSDIAPVLLASGGTVVLQGADGRRELSAEELLRAPLGDRPAHGMIVELRFGSLEAASAFEKLSRRAADAAVASAAAFARVQDGVLAAVGIAVGAVHERPVRAAAVEDLLRGRPFDVAAAGEALRDFCAALNPPDTVHASAAYRRQAGAVIATRALSRAVEQATRRG
jgi:carbon-monoxide dehydrogenase medium subunit